MKKTLMFSVLLLSLVSLYLEQLESETPFISIFIILVDLFIMTILILETISPWIKSVNSGEYFKRNLKSILFLFIYFVFFTINRLVIFFLPPMQEGFLILSLVKEGLLFFKIFGRFRKVALYLNSIFNKPAQTVMLSFVMVILVGCLLLMLPFSSTTSDLTFMNALFTSTSAVCVTGLVVVDTGSTFTLAGQIIIMVLIQIGGLGIMLLSYFIVFLVKKEVTIKDRNLLSYMLNKSDFQSIKKSVRRIILLTFSIEGAGFLLLLPALKWQRSFDLLILWEALFHAVSAFCNAGFSLFSDSLESYSANWLLNMVISMLIISGGLSFAVLTDLFSLVKSRFTQRKILISINSRVVLIGTAVLLIIPLLIIYALEHHHSLSALSLPHQYLAAFFQGVTLRTAGFNSLPFGEFQKATLVFMLLIMFIGGASGSTAGGIKVNTLGAVWGYFLSLLKGRDEVLLYNHQISGFQILQAFSVITFGLFAIILSSLIMAVTEAGIDFLDILFENVSAFATVGLSTGITPGLSPTGKWCIMVLMFIGRIGPLTILAAFAAKSKSGMVSYPETQLQIG